MKQTNGYSTPGSQKVSSRKNKEQKRHACSRKRDFIKSHLGHVTKSDQYEAMKNFESNVMNLPDASDKGLLTGDRVVRKLRRRLKKVRGRPVHVPMSCQHAVRT
jgi:ribosomal protein S20